VPRPSSHPRAAFTLVELLVAALIGVLIASATATSIAQLFRARGASASHQQAFARADSAAGRIALDLANALRRNDPIAQKVSVVHGGTPGQDRDEILMLMNSLRPLRGVEGEPEGGEYEVQYRVMQGPDGGNALWRRCDIAHDEYIDAGGIATPITGGMVALAIQANDGTDQWFDEWDSDSDGLPHAVRVSVTAQSDDTHASATAIRVIALDRVPLPPPTTTDTTDSTSSNPSSVSNTTPNSSTTNKPNGYTSSSPAAPAPPKPASSSGSGSGTGGSGRTGGSGGGSGTGGSRSGGGGTPAPPTPPRGGM
jgi:type II secretion system protein J